MPVRCELNGSVNKQNMCYWSDLISHQMVTKSLHRERVTDWCAVSQKQIIGPFFFEDDDACTLTVNAKHYANTLKIFFF